MIGGFEAKIVAFGAKFWGSGAKIGGSGAKIWGTVVKIWGIWGQDWSSKARNEGFGANIRASGVKNTKLCITDST